MIRDNAKQQADYLKNQAFLLRKQRKKRTRNALISSALNTVSSGINLGMKQGMQQGMQNQ